MANRFQHLIPAADAPAAVAKPRQNRFAALIPKRTLQAAGSAFPEGRFELLPEDAPQDSSQGRYELLPEDEPRITATGPQEVNTARKVDYGKNFDETNNDGSSSFVQGMTLGAGDEIFSAVAAPIQAGVNYLTGRGPRGVAENYQQNMARTQQMLAREREVAPVASAATEIGGALATGKVPAGFIAKGGGLLAKTARGIATGAGYGAAQGFASGNDIDERLQGARDGAAVGSIVGGATAPIAAAVGRGYNAVANRIGNRALAKEAGVRPKVFNRVAKAYADDAATGFTRNADDADLLLNRGAQMQVMAEHIATQPGQGRNILIRELKAQQSEAGKRAVEGIDNTLGRDAGRTVNAQSVEADRKAAGKMFEAARAYRGTFDVTHIRDGLDDLIRESDGSIRFALNKARKLNVFKAGFADKMSASQIHSGRMALDDLMSRPGIGSNAARMLREVRSQLDAELKAKVPGWKEADAAYAGVMSRKQALQDGRDVFQRGYGSPEELAQELRSMSPAARQEFLRGARDSISEIMGTARNDAASARRELFEKGWNREKLRLLVGERLAKSLEGRLAAEADRAQAANNILGNSRTALRQNAKSAFPGGEHSQNLRGVSLVGLGLDAGAWVLNKISGSRRSELSRQAAWMLARKAKEIEPILQKAQAQLGRHLNAKEQIEAVANSLALASLPSR